MRKEVGQRSGGSKGTDVSAPSVLTCQDRAHRIRRRRIEPYGEQEPWLRRQVLPCLDWMGEEIPAVISTQCGPQELSCLRNHH